MGQDRRQSQSDGNKFWCKVFQTRHDFVGAICDEELIGREMEEGDLQLKISKSFYGGMLVSERIALKVMEKITIGNLTGKNIVDLAMKSGFITEENTIVIDGTPHAQFVKI